MLDDSRAESCATWRRLQRPTVHQTLHRAAVRARGAMINWRSACGRLERFQGLFLTAIYLTGGMFFYRYVEYFDVPCEEDPDQVCACTQSMRPWPRACAGAVLRCCTRWRRERHPARHPPVCAAHLLSSHSRDTPPSRDAPPQMCTTPWTWVDALYFTTVTMSTVGYGDLSPSTTLSRAFTSVYILIGIGVVFYQLAKSLSDVFEVRTPERTCRGHAGTHALCRGRGATS